MNKNVLVLDFDFSPNLFFRVFCGVQIFSLFLVLAGIEVTIVKLGIELFQVLAICLAELMPVVLIY